MVNYFRKLYDNREINSIAHKFRMKRFLLFEKTFEEILNSPKEIIILDIGGLEIFWENMGIDKYHNVHILLLNLTKEPTTNANIESIPGDACDMKEFSDKQFEIVFSNSVIEHVGDFSRQLSMANEIQRVGKNYFLQTPNYYFPIEPHLLFIGFQWLPLSVRAFLINHFSLGWVSKISDYNQALKFVSDTRLIKYSELKSMFPKAFITKEKCFMLTKSFLVFEHNNKVVSA